MQRQQTSSFVLLSIIAFIQSPVVTAQETADKKTIEEIVVTAQLREQALIEVPMSVSVISDVELGQKSLDNMWDISFAVPGVVMRQDSPGNTAIYMRGTGNLTGNEALTSAYLDEAPVTIGGFEQLDLRTFDLERVEVLKGPQGTLYGQGAVSGTVRFITKDPVLDSLEGYAKGSFSFTEDGDSSQRVIGMVNIPLVTDVFGLRIAGMLDNSGGWIDQPQAGRSNLNNEDLTHVRVKALWRPIDALNVNGMLIVHRDDTDLGRNYADENGDIQLGIDRAADAPAVTDYDLYNLTMTYDFGFAQLLSASTYIDNERNFPNPFIAGPETAFFTIGLEGNSICDESSEQFTQELRLTSPSAGPLTWTVGGFYRDVDDDQRCAGQSLSTFGLFPTLFEADRESESFAVFVDAAYALTDRLEVGAGVRYFEDDRERSGLPGVTAQQGNFDSLDPRGYISYEVLDDVNVYFNIATGFRSGGFNLPGQPPFGPENLVNYELGTKMSLLGGSVSAELALFYSEWTDMLRRGLVVVNGVFANITDNVGEVEILGFEAAIDWRVADNLTFGFTGAVLDSEVKEINAESTATIPGDPGDYVADYSYTLSGIYDLNWRPDMPGFIRLDYSFRDETHVTDRNIMLPAFVTMSSDEMSLLAARAGLEWNQWTFEVFGTNLLNEEGSVDPFEPWAQAVRLRPRTVGIEIGRQFD